MIHTCPCYSDDNNGNGANGGGGGGVGSKAGFMLETPGGAGGRPTYRDEDQLWLLVTFLPAFAMTISFKPKDGQGQDRVAHLLASLS